jgi:hypothetical protein
MKDLADNIQRSPNEKIGIMPPGPINNDILFHKINDKE